MKQEETALINALRQGERYACDDLVAQYSAQVYRVALRLMGHPVEAEEVLQETLINACKKAKSFEGRASLGTWLYRIATNNSLMRLRRRTLPTVSLDTGNMGDTGGGGNTGANQAEGEEASSPLTERVADQELGPEAQALALEMRQMVEESITALPDSLRDVFVLRELEGLSTQETADVLDISPSNVKVRLHRARAAMRQQLESYVVESPS